LSFVTREPGSSSIRTKATLASRFTHAQRGADLAKLWLYPDVQVDKCDGFTAKEQALVTEVVESNRELIERTWNEYFG
jgi:hypothetical protein